MGQLLAETNPEGETATYGYDLVGNQVERVHLLGEVTRYSYDHRGLVTAIDYNGADQATFAYGAVGNLLRAANSAADERHNYDWLNRLLAVDNLTMEKEV